MEDMEDTDQINDFALKKQKEFLLKEIDGAINDLAKEQGFDQVIIDAWEKGEVKPDYTTSYTFKVPGSVEFKIVASELMKFKKKVQKSFLKSITSKDFKLITEGIKEGRNRKAAETRRFKKIAPEPENTNPKEVESLISQAVKADNRVGADGTEFANWLLSQNISDEIRTEIRGCYAGPPGLKEGRDDED